MIKSCSLIFSQRKRGFICERTNGGRTSNAASPTAAFESVLLTATIDAMERLDVAIIDIPNAFVQTGIEDETDMEGMRTRDKLAELLVIYANYVTVNAKGEIVLYVKFINGLYGVMKVPLLFYQQFIKYLKSKSTKPICCQQNSKWHTNDCLAR